MNGRLGGDADFGMVREQFAYAITDAGAVRARHA